MAIMSIDSALVTQFSSTVHHLAQQTQSRLRPYVEMKKMVGDEWAYDRLGETESILANGRNEKITFQNVEHTRRKIPRDRFYVALPIDRYDVEGMLQDPQSNYAKAIVNEINRRMDRVIVNACFADVATGRNFGTTVTFADDGGVTVNATGGVTYEKLLEVNRNFTDNEVGNEMPVRKALCISGDEEEALMKEVELISGDYTRYYQVERGEIMAGAGFDFIKYGANVTNPILPVASTTRSCPVIAQGGICVGLNKDIELKVQERPDLLDTVQIVATIYIGAVRTEGTRIIKFNTTA